MKSFIHRHADKITGVLSGFDRLRLRGTLRWLSSVSGMNSYLWNMGVLLKDFRAHALAVTERVRQAVQALTLAAGLQVRYLDRPGVSKEDLARRIAAERNVCSGLVCVLSAVEPCWTFEMNKNAQTRRLELRSAFRKCLHYYFYQVHPKFGFMHVRLQTWFPLTIHVCINGREWLARQMDQEGLGYLRRDNAIVAVADPRRAQQLLDVQLQTDWPAELDALAAASNPAHAGIFARHPTQYYWSADQSEWATDVLFRDPKDLAGLYPGLVRTAMMTFGSRDVLRFLGQKVPTHGWLPAPLKAEIVSELIQRPEGIRVRHRRNSNSVKMYDKQGSVFRVETTIQDARDLKVYRPKEGDPQGAKSWRPLRKGVADLHRRAQLSQQANERYLEALSEVQTQMPLRDMLDPVSRPRRWKGRRFRALRPLSPDDRLLLAGVGRGEFVISGFRNGDIRALLYASPPRDRAELHKWSAAVTRRLRLLRAHGIIAKLSGTRRYQVTTKGRQLIAAVTTAQEADIQKLASAA
jgi:hypothetical protein